MNTKMILLSLALSLGACSSGGDSQDMAAADMATSAPDQSTAADMATPPAPPVKVTPMTLEQHGWKMLQVNTAQAGIGTAPRWPANGTGSVGLVPGSGMGMGAGKDWPDWKGFGGKAFLGTQAANKKLLTDLAALGYSTFSDWGQVPKLAPYINIFVDLDGDGKFDKAHDDILVYSPSDYQADQCRNLEWQHWDALDPGSKGWGCVFGNAKVGATKAACARNTPYAWADLVAGNAGATIAPASCGEVPFPSMASPAPVNPDCMTPDPDAPGLLFVTGQKSGDGYDQYRGYVDNVRLGVAGTAPNTFDFEPQ